ncbi:MAG: lipoyl(octanoyl) transferase [Neolewinella sp.]
MAVEIENLGQKPYEPLLIQMRELHEAVQRGADGRIWLVEHDPVYTAGRATPPEQLTDGIVPIERGGKITYHGPGQLTVYPIVALPKRDLRDWLKRIENFGVRIAKGFDLDAEPSVDGTGVFANGRKFASIGVHVKRWVNMHGIGINVSVGSAPWQRVRPCGLSPDIMTDLSTAVGRPIAMQEVIDVATAAVSVLVDPNDPL